MLGLGEFLLVVSHEASVLPAALCMVPCSVSAAQNNSANPAGCPGSLWQTQHTSRELRQNVAGDGRWKVHDMLWAWQRNPSVHMRGALC